ncbi:AMP-binding protein [Ascidiimonas sp. W6]|uniref:AMP-binding protein n=1 Tax=Ascidiimonas meishanensis TaxID=3128903 RepID=UPI0030EC368C
MTPTYKNIHLKFKWNGYHFNREELNEIAYSLIKEGEPYEQSVGDFLIDWLNDKDYIDVKTSGSTGKPKLVRLKKQYMVNSAIATGDFFNVSVGDRALHCLPAEYIAGKMMLIRALILGLDVDFVAPSLHPLSYSNKEYDFCALIPLQLQNSLPYLHLVKTIIVGGASVSNELLESIQDKETIIYETYGMTETVTHIAAKRLNNFSSDKAKEVKTFKTLPDVTVNQDKRNCLVINAPNISDEAIVTNDLVNLVSDREFEWIGRFDNIINSGGVKLIPEQIEAKLDKIIENRFFVAGLPDEKLGKKLVLIVEGDNLDKEVLSKKVNELSTLEKFEIPKEIISLSKFKETENGKIKRQKTLKKLMTHS